MFKLSERYNLEYNNLFGQYMITDQDGELEPTFLDKSIQDDVTAVAEAAEMIKDKPFI